MITKTSTTDEIAEFARTHHHTDWPEWLHTAPVGDVRSPHGQLLHVATLWVDDGTSHGRVISRSWPVKSSM